MSRNEMRHPPSLNGVTDVKLPGKTEATMSPRVILRKRNRRRKIFTCLNIFLVLAVFQTVLFLCSFLSGHFRASGTIHLEHSAMIDMHGQNGNDTNSSVLTNNTELLLLDTALDVNETGPPLDDYYSRPHIGKPVPLVIGGTDGSGTRAFVDVLTQLHVPMIIDDSGTLDVHATKMFGGKGWPPLANMVLKETHSSNYQVQDLSNATQRQALLELERLTDGFNDRYQKLINNPKAQNVTVASNVTYGYKAPVAMLFLPLLQHIHKDGLKFIHVVRDGRDVSLSKNQSPIKKFYKDSYPDGENRLKQYQDTEMAPVLGMHLWNDWNTGVFEWERRHADGHKFDFLVMRTEDLLDPRTKFESLLQLADFVGSPKTLEELCCLSREAVTDMGESGLIEVPQKNSGGQGARRYGPRARHRHDRNKSGGFFSWLFGYGSRERTKSSEVTTYVSLRREKRAERDPEARKRMVEKIKRRHEATLKEREERRRLAAVPRIGRPRNGRFVPPVYDTIGKPRPKTNEKKPKNHREKPAPPVSQRYGKWAKMLQDRPELVARLHQDGKRGLEAFGYEPRSRFMDRAPGLADFECDEHVICDG